MCDWIKLSHVDCWFFRKNTTGQPPPPAPPAPEPATEVEVIVNQDGSEAFDGDALCGAVGSHRWHQHAADAAAAPNSPPEAMWFATTPDVLVRLGQGGRHHRVLGTLRG